MIRGISAATGWFDDELKEMFGVDVYARPFPADRGWDVYENDRARVLLIRQENLDALADALGALCRVEPSSFDVVPCNIGEDKAYAQQYGIVKKTLRLSEQELDSIYSLPYVRHLYTSKEIEGFKMRWRGAGACPARRRAA